MTEQIEQMRIEEEVWSLMNPQIDGLSPEDDLGELVHEGKFERIGVYLGGLLVTQMMGTEPNPVGMIIALTKQHIATVDWGHETHDKRMLASRLAGRFFAQHIEEPVEYLVQLAPIWISGTEGHKGPVKTDPFRREGAMCIVREMKGFYEAKTLDECFEVMGSHNTKLWQVAMHEGLPYKVSYEGVVCLPSRLQPETSENSTDEEDKNILYIDNIGMNELMAGFSSCLPAMKQDDEGAPT